MKQTLYGPWSIAASREEGGAREGFDIRGSSNADGFYELEAGAPLAVDVDGAEWTVELMAMLPFEDPSWFSYDPVRNTQYKPPQGLTMRMAVSEEGVKLFFGPFVLTMVLHLVSTDPVLNPPIPPIPFDFTIPKR